jgi:hypothetical protein
MPVTLSVSLASGAAPLSYQWSLNGINLVNDSRTTGAQSNVLTITNATTGDTGVYGVVVSNSLGRAATNVALTVFSTGQTVTSNNLTIPANAEIHGAGNAGLPDGSGVMPTLINLPTNALMVVISNVSGLISLNGGSGSNNADGVEVSGSGYPSQSYAGPYGGISGITIPGAGAIIGVFETASAPTGSAPASLDFTVIGTNFSSYAPALWQTFYVGDGLTGTGIGPEQLFMIPAGATRLYLGITDASGFNGSPGGYGDNKGAFTASVVAYVPDPVLLSPQAGAGGMSFGLQTFVNQSYTVWQATNVAGGNWSYYSNFVGDGLVDWVTVPMSSGPPGFFRVSEP